MIDYILALVISFAGIILGSILALIAPEELKAGKKWWQLLEWAVFIAIIAAMFYFAKINFLWTGLIAALLALLKIAKMDYPALAFVLLLSFADGFLFLAASLIFIYGLPKGTLEAMPIVNMRNSKKSILRVLLGCVKRNILYLILGLAVLPFLAAYL